MEENYEFVVISKIDNPNFEKLLKEANKLYTESLKLYDKALHLAIVDAFPKALDVRLLLDSVYDDEGGFDKDFYGIEVLQPDGKWYSYTEGNNILYNNKCLMSLYDWLVGIPTTVLVTYNYKEFKDLYAKEFLAEDYK